MGKFINNQIKECNELHQPHATWRELSHIYEVALLLI